MWFGTALAKTILKRKEVKNEEYPVTIVNLISSRDISVCSGSSSRSPLDGRPHYGPCDHDPLGKMRSHSRDEADK